MSYKFFLDLNPEYKVPSFSLLLIFRNTKIKNEAILEEMLNKTVKQAKEKGIIKSNSIIADAAHTNSKYGKYLPELVEKSKKTGIEVKEVIGDKAYSGKDNLEFGEENDIKIISRINNVITNSEKFLYKKR